MKERDAWALFSQIVNEDLPELQENLIVGNSDGYSAFGHYNISRKEHGYQVKRKQAVIAIFSEMRTALSWCIADKYKQLHLANDILDLDQQKQTASADYRVRYRLYEQLSANKQALIEQKIEARRDRIIAINNKLSQCVGIAKYWQIRGFNNETERIRRTASNRKNR
jgi:hypothetical protein